MERHRRTRAQRAKVLSLARTLARTGQFPDHTSIIAQLGPLDAVAHDNVRSCLE
jgi:hypothetical protein